MSPIYEFLCDECSTVKEHLCKADQLQFYIKCEDCGSTTTRIISVPNFVLKGDGFYAPSKNDESE